MENSNPIRLFSAHYLDSWDLALAAPEVLACAGHCTLVWYALLTKKPLDSERWGGRID